MSSAAETVENASIISESTVHDGNRLWIGNIDPKITEYHLVKLLEKFGKVKQFDFLFHKSGPLEGQPRGYCFVNFSTREEAERAIQCLNGKLALSKKLVVRWAHAQVRVTRALCCCGDVWKVVLRGMSADVDCCSSAGPALCSSPSSHPSSFRVQHTNDINTVFIFVEMSYDALCIYHCVRKLPIIFPSSVCSSV
ncbi:probable RNA-binding protein 18 isoform X3 [Nothobranchius furzeri]|uniref:probable RNA-binding protein 18 isoform X3 n=1 Tax=Nothobranchius furzeri TaxID=105023 RepID=UPI0039049754